MEGLDTGFNCVKKLANAIISGKRLGNPVLLMIWCSCRCSWDGEMIEKTKRGYNFEKRHRFFQMDFTFTFEFFYMWLLPITEK